MTANQIMSHKYKNKIDDVINYRPISLLSTIIGQYHFYQQLKANITFINNYEPISLLSTISKLLERIVFKHVYNYMHKNIILSKHSSGFRPTNSIVNQPA